VANERSQSVLSQIGDGSANIRLPSREVLRLHAPTFIVADFDQLHLDV
jgi:hypothetical protein